MIHEAYNQDGLEAYWHDTGVMTFCHAHEKHLGKKFVNLTEVAVEAALAAITSGGILVGEMVYPGMLSNNERTRIEKCGERIWIRQEPPYRFVSILQDDLRTMYEACCKTRDALLNNS